MAFSVLSLAVIFLASDVYGQFNPNKALPVCNTFYGNSGYYLMAHPNYCELYISCNNANEGKVKQCAYGTLFDQKSGVCNHPGQSVCEAWQCNSTAHVGNTFPAACCEHYYVCNGASFEKRECPQGQTFSATTGVCGTNTGCTDHELCIRFGKTIPDPRINCTLAADPSGNPCTFRMRVHGNLSEPFKCAAGTAFSADNCTCVASNQCTAVEPLLLNKVPDSQCRASFRTEMETSTRSEIPTPIVYSDKLATTPTQTGEYISFLGVDFNGNTANFNPNPQITNNPYLYSYSFSNKQLAAPTVFSIVFRADRPGTYQILSNTYDAGGCQPTVALIVTASNGLYQANLYVTGATRNTATNQVFISTNLTASITVGTSDYVDCTFFFQGNAYMQLINRGATGQGTGQVVTSTTSSNLGDYLAYNQCGYQFGRSLSGSIKRIICREACSDPTKARS